MERLDPRFDRRTGRLEVEAMKHLNIVPLTTVARVQEVDLQQAMIRVLPILSEILGTPVTVTPRDDVEDTPAQLEMRIATGRPVKK